MASGIGRHLVSSIRSQGLAKVACWMVGHFASKTRSPGTCKVACWSVGHFANKTRSLGTCKVAYWMVGHFASNFQSRPPLAKYKSFAPNTQRSGARRVQPLAEFSQAERSEAAAEGGSRRRRPAPKAPCAEGAPEPREGRQGKLEAFETGSE